MNWLKCLTAVCFLSGGVVSPASALDYEEYPSIKLRSLDKITARTLTFDAQVGSTIKFGEIYIKIQSCRKPPPVEKNEASAFLQIWQVDKTAKESRWVFSGWMFSSSPALSGMDHPVYDVWVIDCLGKDPEAMPAAEEKPTDALPDEGTVPENSVIKPDISPEKQKANDTTTTDTDIPSDTEVAPDTQTNEQPIQEEQIEQPTTANPGQGNKTPNDNIDGIY